MSLKKLFSMTISSNNEYDQSYHVIAESLSEAINKALKVHEEKYGPHATISNFKEMLDNVIA